MAYQAIYRKWRPLVFEDIIGQSHITRTLRNQILTGKIGHAYLFCGTRGTGKTTAAKVFSRAVNCLNNVDGSPCNKCDVCRGILHGSIMDVSEIDAASNNSVENIREIREEVAYTATNSKYKVYIIDEVHMLSSGAFNALLKTLEEPPEHVIFILATTEAHKIPQTILSRCQRFDFKRIKPSDIILRMKEIASGDGLNISDDAYALLAKLADGSMRDGLSILERCVSSYGNNLTVDNIIDVLGITTSELTFNIANAIIEKDTNAVLTTIDRLISDGRDLHTFVDTVISHFRDLLVCKVSNEPEQILDYSVEDIVKLKSQADKLTFEKTSYVTTILTNAKSDAKWLKNPRVIYELSFVKLCRPELDDSKEALLDRLSNMEEKIKNGIAVKEVVVEEKPTPPPAPKKPISERVFKTINQASLTPDHPYVVVAKKWDKILQSIKKNANYVAHCINKKITIDGEGIIILFEKENAMSKTITDTYINTVEDMVKKSSGVDLRVKTAFREDIEDYIIDFWNLKPCENPSPAPIEKNDKSAINDTEDPLDILANTFPEIVEFTDESEFINYNADNEHFEQSSIEDTSYRFNEQDEI